MKKFLIALALGIVLVLALATTASADNGPHGGFTATTDACAACHRLHSAQSGTNDLLRLPQKELCFSCHNGQGANTDVTMGVYTNAAISGTEGVDGKPLMGGGFINALMATNTTAPAASLPVTSTHTVGFYGTAWGSGASATGAGANYGASIMLECGSCHDPHGKAGYTNNPAPAVPTAGLANACDPSIIATNPCTLKTASYRLLRWQPKGSAGYTAPVNVNWSGGALPTNGATTGWTVPDNYAALGTEWYTIGTVGAFATNDYMPGNNVGNVYNVAADATTTPPTLAHDYQPAAVSTAFFCAQCHDRYLNNTRLRNYTDESAYCGKPTGSSSTNPAVTLIVDDVDGVAPWISPKDPNCLPVMNATNTAVDKWGDDRSSGDAAFMYRHNSGDVRTSSDGTVVQTATAFTAVGRTCLSCHVAHGTSSKADANLTIGGDQIDPSVQAFPLTAGSNNMGGSLAGGSVLLRMDGRTVCMRCHAGDVNAVFP